jgi:hypothetical protein
VTKKLEYYRMRFPLLVLVISSILSSEAATPAEDAFGGLDLARMAGNATGVSDVTGGFAQLQQNLETEFPAGMSRSDVLTRLAEASRNIPIQSGFRLTTAFYINATYIYADRAIGAGVARLTIRFKFDKQCRLDSVRSVLSFETSKDNCIWPEDTGGPTPSQKEKR